MMCWRTEWKRIVMVLFVLAGAVAANAQTRPEFSGTWQQDNAHSVPARTGDTTLKIVQHDP
ncbi:hypothetical protein GOB94_12145 [Granulicella sp. 5B5]|nr:hypothetical protein GOB94_12145 [Granulicella sp. 5B5]